MTKEPTIQTNQTIACPKCQQADQTYKVSQVFLESSTRLQGDALDQPKLERLLDELCPDPSECSERDHLVKRFVQVFAPPAGGPRPSRRLHPDAAIVVFLMLLMFLLYQIATTQAHYLPYALGILAMSLLAYVLGRSRVVRKHRAQNRQEQDSTLRAEAALHRWGRLYFCSRDHGVFLPDDSRLIPLEEIQPYLNEP